MLLRNQFVALVEAKIAPVHFIEHLHGCVRLPRVFPLVNVWKEAVVAVFNRLAADDNLIGVCLVIGKLDVCASTRF